MPQGQDGARRAGGAAEAISLAMQNIQYRVVVEEIRDGLIRRRCESTVAVDGVEGSQEHGMVNALHSSLLNAAVPFYGSHLSIDGLSLFFAGVARSASELGMVLDWSQGPFADMHATMELVGDNIEMRDQVEDHVRIVISQSLAEAIEADFAKRMDRNWTTEMSRNCIERHVTVLDDETFTSLGSPRL